MSYNNIKLAAYGEYESGKTDQIRYLIRKFGPQNVIIGSAEGGLETIESDLADTKVCKLTGLTHARAFITQLKDGALKEYNSPEKWVCFDGMSRILDWMLDEYMTDAEACFEKVLDGAKIPINLKRFQCCVTENDKFDQMRVYMLLGRAIKALVSDIINLDSSVYANFMMEATRNVRREPRPPYGPECPGKVGRLAVMGAFDFVFHLILKDIKGVRTLVATTRGNDEYLARRRHDYQAREDIPDEIIGFNLAEFYNLICGEPRKENGND